MINKNYYSVIILDVTMPVMNGIGCYTEAVKAHPEIKRPRAFFTAYDKNENIDFFKKNGLRYLLKTGPPERNQKKHGSHNRKNTDAASYRIPAAAAQPRNFSPYPPGNPKKNIDTALRLL